MRKGGLIVAAAAGDSSHFARAGAGRAGTGGRRNAGGARGRYHVRQAGRIRPDAAAQRGDADYQAAAALRQHAGIQVSRNLQYNEKGPAWYWNWIEVGEHVGTHFDAPCHWVTGKAKACVDQLEAKQFIGPAAVLNVTAEVAKNPDFVATKDTVLAWEKKHGRLPKGSWVILRTGWGARATDAAKFLNVGKDGAPHYPGFGKDSADFLTKERDILGVGVEQVGTDAAVGAKSDPPFPNHSIMHGAGRFGLTQLANVDKLPESGAIVIATPLNIEHGSGSPVRVIAIAPATR